MSDPERASTSSSAPLIRRHVAAGEACCNPAWEEAYNRFETAEQEIAKFVRRLRKLGVDRRPRSIRCAELFCGRGGGLVALERLGFHDLAGVDLSESLLARYRGPAKLHLADCRDLPLDCDSFDAVMVQGGLHHLPRIPEDLDAVLREANRVLRPDGRLYVIEPWLTPFLKFVHAVVERPLVRKFYAKGDALATMTEHERDTYEQWLGQPEIVVRSLESHFESELRRATWGKLHFVGRPRPRR